MHLVKEQDCAEICHLAMIPRGIDSRADIFDASHYRRERDEL